MKLRPLLLSLCCIALGYSAGAQQAHHKQTMSTTTAVPDSLYPPANLVIPHHSEWSRGHYPEKIKEFKEHPLHTGDIVFLGNSITEKGGDWGKRFGMANTRNRGISGDVTDGVLHRLGEIIYYKPRAVFLMIGINDLADETITPAYVANNILTIVAAIQQRSPATKIFVESILPTAHALEVARIRQVNDQLQSKAVTNHFTFLDVHHIMADKDDLMTPAYTVDGVHLSEAGYKVWVDGVRGYVKAIR